MAKIKERACKICKTIHEEEKCPKCGSKDFNENYKGRIVVLNAAKSEIAQKVGLKEEGNFALKTR